MSAWDIYYKEMLSQGHGHAVWEADPGLDAPVDIADIGYMENGAFIRLFNASKNIGDVSNDMGNPDGYSPLHRGTIREGTLSASSTIMSDTILQHQVEDNLSIA